MSSCITKVIHSFFFLHSPCPTLSSYYWIVWLVCFSSASMCCLAEFLSKLEYSYFERMFSIQLDNSFRLYSKKKMSRDTQTEKIGGEGESRSPKHSHSSHSSVLITCSIRRFSIRYLIRVQLVPQVEKQDKKKKRTGRAKRRMQYNRRFVNVVQTFGRRRGPNANS